MEGKIYIPQSAESFAAIYNALTSTLTILNLELSDFLRNKWNLVEITSLKVIAFITSDLYFCKIGKMQEIIIFVYNF